jgi:RHS repeat-associated protein
VTELAIAGDMDCDGDVDFDDISCYNQAINNCPGGIDPNTYGCVGCDCLNGDFDGDGDVDSADNTAFVAAIGESTGSHWTAFSWDAENRLTAVTPQAPSSGAKKVAYAYDYANRRIERKVYDWDPNSANCESTPSDWTRYVYDGWRVVLEVDVDSGDPNTLTVEKKYTWGLDLSQSLSGVAGIGGLLAVQDVNDPNDVLDYVYAYDANGNVGQLIDLSAANASVSMVARYEYDPYGAVIGPDDDSDGDWTDDAGSYAVANTMRFSTKAFDDLTGLGYWGQRWYHPTLGRWMSRDPIGENGGWNLYAYVANLETARIDSLGLAVPTLFGITSNARRDARATSMLQMLGDSVHANTDEPFPNYDCEHSSVYVTCVQKQLCRIRGSNREYRKCRTWPHLRDSCRVECGSIPRGTRFERCVEYCRAVERKRCLLMHKTRLWLIYEECLACGEDTHLCVKPPGDGPPTVPPPFNINDFKQAETTSQVERRKHPDEGAANTGASATGAGPSALVGGPLVAGGPYYFSGW